MKFTMSLVAVAALSFVTSAFAQEEESPSPSPSPEEKASATVEDKPSPTATPEEPKKAETTASPAAGKKETTAATSPAKSASPAAATSGKKMSTEAALKDMENRWAAALGKHDTASIESMVADDFIGVSSKGKVQNRRGMLAEVKGGKDTYTSTKNEKLDVRMYGSNIAVVVGTYREKGTGKDGKAFDRSFRFTDTWVDRGGKWQCIASQVALVSQK